MARHATDPRARHPARPARSLDRRRGASGAAEASSRSTSPARKPGAKADGRGQAHASARASSAARLPRRQARHLPRARQARARALRPLGAAVDEGLQAEAAQERLRLPDHARRHQARDRRPPARAGRGPYPTLVEYSGYGYAEPGRRARAAISPIANLLGYAVVDVNMRGTGCSGGAFDYFEPLQGLDGYDVIETVARQPWVAHHKVGMVGVSYGGISQLFVAADAAAEPGRDHAAVGDRQHRDDALSGRHPQHRLRARRGPRTACTTRRPASTTGGQPWALKRIQGGDKTCKANQALHAEAVDLIAKIARQPLLRAEGRRPARARSRSCTRSRCRCSWPASGPTSRPAATARRCRSTSPAPKRKWFTFTNGAHIDSLDPATFKRWYDFLELYVAHRRPQLPARACATPRRSIFKAAHGRRRRDAARRPDPGAADLRGGARRVRGAAVGPDPVRQRRRRLDAGRARRRLRALVLALPAAGHDARARGTSRRAARSPTPTPARGGHRRVHLEPRPRGRRRASPATPAAARTGCGRRRPRTSGRRTRRAPRCPT